MGQARCPVCNGITTELRCALVRIGISPLKYSGHSFGAEAATTAASQGIGDATIKLLEWLNGIPDIHQTAPI